MSTPSEVVSEVDPDRTYFRTVPTIDATSAPPEPPRPWWRLPRSQAISLAALLSIIVLLSQLPGPDAGLSTDGKVTIWLFAIAVWAWVFTKLDDTYVALAAGAALVLLRVVDSDTLFVTLGDDTIWLLVAAFVIAAGVTTSGLATRAAGWLITPARSLRALVHLVSAAIVVTAFAIPSTSGRAALLVPVFIALATALSAEEYGGQFRRATLVLALVFPTVILLSAVGSLLGAGAHLVTSRVLSTATGEGFDFAEWLVLGLPLAVVSSHLAAELILWLFAKHEDRAARFTITLAQIDAASPTRVTGPLTVAESRASLIMLVVIALWCTEALHGVHPAIVALLGALVTTSPRYGSTTLKKTLASVPWPLLMFMAATLALGDALITSGAAEWLADSLLGGLNVTGVFPFMLVIVALSALAHLVIQSRSARSAVLIPIVVALSPAMGVDPAAAAFASTAAAGLCHTLPSSAKPVALFSDVEGFATYGREHLLRLSTVLAPLMIALVLAFSFLVWPLLGLSL